MSENGNRDGRHASFLAACCRHGFALLATLFAAVAAWTGGYFFLFLWAIFTGAGLGGPLAYPAGLIVVILATLAAVLLLLLPATVFAEWCSRRWGFAVTARISASVAMLGLLSLAFSAAFAASGGFESVAAWAGIVFVANLAPLGIYWWAARSVEAFQRICLRFARPKF